ncbi:hypothetical protein G6O69_03425 [Pseudenhygromyxa sp. WMMC2535]|uniref:hypothetical protein n=1 Tax=Pseudenhygromyxa sp. WMMC2535 TaxID=2712867 RepID=UPI00155726DE|nr:hypothetical protein [Pseudenhygromyxa sp. WMMC2535]NVB36865.1 hypothetical protein [Pseudenhygromyxa sp. WMMC2535]
MATKLLSTLTLLSVLVLGEGCGEHRLDGDCDGMCQPYGPTRPGVGECKDGMCTPTFGECITKDEITTCSEACEVQGSVCVENGCAGGTYLIYAVEEWCEEHDDGSTNISHGCEEPVDWQVNSTVECCCAQ